MSGFELPTKAQILESCNAIESVLDALRDHTNVTLTNRSRILNPIKALFTSLQRLEEDEDRIGGAFHTADARARHNLAGVLTSCCVVAGQLRKRISSNALRHDDGLGIELMTLTSEVEEFLRLRKKVPSSTNRPKPASASESSALVEDLLRKQQKHQSEVEVLELELQTLYARERTFEEEIGSLRAELAEKDKLISGLQNHNDAKLYHIRRLHAAISNLGLRHPMTHKTHAWDDLTDELPTMVQRIENINLKLKELELERDKLQDQEHDSEADTILDAVPSVPKTAAAAVNASKPSSKDKERDKDAKKKKEHRKSSDGKVSTATTKVRSPSPTSSETSRANTSKSVRRKSRSVNTGSGFFFGN